MIEVGLQVGREVLSVRASMLSDQSLDVVLGELVDQLCTVRREVESVVERPVKVLRPAGQLEQVERSDVELAADVDHRVRVFPRLFGGLLDRKLLVRLAVVVPSLRLDRRWREQQDLRLVQAVAQQELDDLDQVLAVSFHGQRWIELERGRIP